uniref:Uncharacterized protein n=1 Tax=Brassica oleracea var. oleracea TaxID=109376 RepID=A0A0D3BS49_BRAOL
MRVKRQKKNRRTVRFFTVCFGFRQPFKVLCDGTFVHHLVSKDITPADAAVSELPSSSSPPGVCLRSCRNWVKITPSLSRLLRCLAQQRKLSVFSTFLQCCRL